MKTLIQPRHNQPNPALWIISLLRACGLAREVQRPHPRKARASASFVF